MLGFKLTGKTGTVRAMDGGRKEVVDKVEGQEIGIHTVKNDVGEDVYQLTGEFYRTGYYMKEQELADKINQQYAARKIKKELEMQGYQVSENANYAMDAAGNINITMVSYQ